MHGWGEAVDVAEIDIGTAMDENAGDVRVAGERGVDERGSTSSVGEVWIGAEIEEQGDEWNAQSWFTSGKSERGPAVGVGGDDVENGRGVAAGASELADIRFENRSSGIEVSLRRRLDDGFVINPSPIRRATFR